MQNPEFAHGIDTECKTRAVSGIVFNIDASRLGRDHVTFELNAESDDVTIRRDARDVESAWLLDRDRWSAFLGRISQVSAPSVFDGVRQSVDAGQAAEVMRAVRDLARLTHSETDWDLGMSGSDRATRSGAPRAPAQRSLR